MQIQTNTSLPLAQVEHNQLQAPSLLPNAVRDLAKTGDATLQTSQGNLNVGLSDQVQAAALKAFEEQLSQLLSNPGPSDQTPVEALDQLPQPGSQSAESGLAGVKPYADLEKKVSFLEETVSRLRESVSKQNDALLLDAKNNYQIAVRNLNQAKGRGAASSIISYYVTRKNHWINRMVNIKADRHSSVKALAAAENARTEAKTLLALAIEMDED